ncbi:MAG: S8 family serine peptidase, partial [Ignavibacteriaceae bacterium]|nr:S8 family serine peptidase [Ignavibacteriaceae bacterium]
MKKLFFLCCLLTSILYPQFSGKIGAGLRAQYSSVLQNEEVLVWIFFTDKNTSLNLLSSPEQVVSQKSLQRRSKVLPAENLIDYSDLPVSLNYISTLEELGIKIKQKSKWFNGVSAYLNAAKINEILNLSFVREIDIVYKLKKSPPIEEDQLEAGNFELIQPEGVHALDYGASFTQNNQISVPAVHDLGVTGQGIYICVMDAGFNRLSHESFNAMNIIATWDFVNNDPGVGDSTDMGSGTHGTQTLSTIGGYKPGQLIGPAFGATYMLAKTENTVSETPIEEDNWIAAAEWADSIGVDVTSTSLGYITFDPPYTSYTWQDMNGNTCRITIGADIAASKGIVVVNSAGNEGFNATRNTLGAPSDGDSVLAIGAVTSTGTRSSFSSVGNTVDGRIKPDVMAMGSSVRVASTSNNTQYTTASGTSFSCPLAAGVAALILSFNPNLTPMQVINTMRNTASQAANPNREFGWGILNAQQAILFATTPDATPPDPVTDLQAINPTSNSLQLSWTVPNDTSPGGVRNFDIRYSLTPISDTIAFNSANQLSYNHVPAPTGTPLSLNVSNLAFNTTYYFSIRSADVWGNKSNLSNLSSGTTWGAPAFQSHPDSIYYILTNMSEKNDTLFIQNISANPSTLQFTAILENQTFPAGMFGLKYQAPSITTEQSVENEKSPKEQFFGYSIEGSGGPDAFGYKWIDSDHPAGPQFNWSDISETGTMITNWIPTGSFSATDEGYAGPINTGFPFKYYGNTYNSFYISTNGFITFSPVTASSITNANIPSTAFPNNYAAPFWDDLDGKTSGRVYYLNFPDKTIIQFTNWERYSATGTLTFQVVLMRGGQVYFYYNSLSATLNSATVGIENSTGTVGLPVVYNANYLKNNLAVKFSADPEWLFINGVQGTIYSGNTLPVVLRLESQDYPHGMYTADLKITTNDPVNPVKVIPVKLLISDIVPVELLGFNYNVTGNNVSLNWSTATEVNNSGFEVQRKHSGNNWESAGFVTGRGNSTEFNNYNFNDKPTKPGFYQYRLKQIDFDGSYSYSHILDVDILPLKFSITQNYPNPFNPSTKVGFYIPETGIVKAFLYNSQGELVETLLNSVLES